MSAFVANLSIEKGADFEQDFEILNDDGTPFNFSGCIGYSKIRKHVESDKFNTFTVEFVSPPTQGIVRILMSREVTSMLQLGRNVYDIFVLDTNDKITKVVEGMVIVNGSATYGRTSGNQLGDLGEVNTNNLQDGDVLMYNENEQQLEFNDSDQVLDNAAADGDLPNEFIDLTINEINNNVEADGGEY